MVNTRTLDDHRMFIHGIVPWIWDWKFNHYLGEAKKRVAPQHENRKKN